MNLLQTLTHKDQIPWAETPYVLMPIGQGEDCGLLDINPPAVTAAEQTAHVTLIDLWATTLREQLRWTGANLRPPSSDGQWEPET